MTGTVFATFWFNAHVPLIVVVESGAGLEAAGEETVMSEQYVTTYLNDHLAGSVLALELLDQLQKQHAGTPLESLVAPLRVDIEADQSELKALIGRLGVGTSVLRKATAWLAEKVAELKLKADDPTDGPLRLLESLETVSLGIEGKRGLWIVLETTAASNPALRGIDYGRLGRRAEEQRSRVEAARLDAARAALG